MNDDFIVGVRYSPTDPDYFIYKAESFGEACVMNPKSDEECIVEWRQKHEHKL